MAGLGALAIAALATTVVAVIAQTPPAVAPPAPAAVNPVVIPGFWDPRRRPERPDLSRVTLIRFLTENDYAPFDYAGPDGNPAGFNVDLSRMVCEELKIACTVQMRRFDTLIDSLNDNRGDAVVASMAITRDMRQKVDFSDPYYRTPARFAARKTLVLDNTRPETLVAKKVAVVAGSAHEAYLKLLYPDTDVHSYPSMEEAREALRQGETDLLFGDGITLSFWINGADSAGCCAFRGGPYTESRYFGEGVGIAVKRGNDALRQGFNWALFRIWEKGRFSDLWLRYFPVSPY